MVLLSYSDVALTRYLPSPSMSHSSMTSRTDTGTGFAMLSLIFDIRRKSLLHITLLFFLDLPQVHVEYAFFFFDLPITFPKYLGFGGWSNLHS